MMVLKNKHFIIGFGFLGILIIASLLSMIFFGDKIFQEQFVYGKKNEIIEVAPFPPSLKHPLGTNTDGYDLLHIIIHGSKYTLGISALIVFLRVAISLVFGVWMSFHFKRIKNLFKPISESTNYISATLIVYFILASVLVMEPGGFESTIGERIIFQIIIMTLIAIPTLSVLFNDETERVLQEPFMESVKVLGGGTWYTIVKHVMPYMTPRLFIISSQQMISTMILLSHLGFLQIYFGGVFMDYSLMQTGPKTMTYEWSGLIGDSFDLISIYPWIPLAPILFFALTCISLQLMVIGLRESYFGQDLVKNKGKSSPKLNEKTKISSQSFQSI